jgi:hypothetical protein
MSGIKRLALAEAQKKKNTTQKEYETIYKKKAKKK